jgi:nicotinate-nucleotide adenylyltransferase
MRRLCLGGTFDPIHRAHTTCASAAASEGGFDQVVLIPANLSPHKMADAAASATADQRLAMCQRAAQELNNAAGRELFQVESIDLERPPPSYTIDTVRLLKKRGWSEVHWLIGGDQLPALPRWHEAHSLMQEATIWVMARPGFVFDFAKLPPTFAVLASRVLKAPLLEISATEIRRRVRNGLPIDEMVGRGVAQYIADQRLYQPNR